MKTVLVVLSHAAAPFERRPDSAVAEAREAFGYWTERAESLPWHRRAQRREARELAARWRARLVAAHLERLRLGRLQRAVAPLLDTGGRSVAAQARRLALASARRTAIGRRIIMAAVVSAAVAAAATAATAALVLHGLGAL